ncbi:MAG: rRNA (cytosine967-C5)-methyltransferase [Candidatus Sumerlaeota bacterium]|nr:rRNA (cytosine967-C5)-methyltransferase [Candidatus Sumerlaeota bacterium]
MPLTLPKSPKHDDLRAHLLELYARLVSTPIPPDHLIARFFRIRQDLLPPGPRAFLAATAYALLRRRYRTLLLHQWAERTEAAFDWPEPGAVPPALKPMEEGALALARWMAEDLGAPPEETRSLVDAALSLLRRRELPEDEFPMPALGAPEKLARDFLPRIAADPGLRAAPEHLRRAAALSMPWDLLARWDARYGPEGAEAMVRALGQPAPLDVRVNVLKGTREECADRLAAERHPCAPTPLSPHGLRLTDKANLFRSDLFADGWFEVQDEASQLVAFALDPKPTWRVLDACSGGGGKSLHLAALMKNRGEIFAHDIQAERLDPQRKRLRRADIHNVRFLEPGAAAASGPYDAVLIDAPCLGFGTLRRNPDLAWRGPLPTRLAEIAELQNTCLRAYAPLVKPGGVLVYATCSFEPEETTELLRTLDGFVPDPLAPRFARYGIDGLVDGEQNDLAILPHIHGTDGFFIARLRKT